MTIPNNLKHLNWRYATKKFDPTRKLTSEELSTLENALNLAPSSFGLQPWKFFVVSNPEVRKKLQAAAHNQSQIVDASHLVVLAVRKGMDAADVDRYIARIASVRGMPAKARGISKRRWWDS